MLACDAGARAPAERMIPDKPVRHNPFFGPLARARQKAAETDQRVAISQQDMRSFVLPRPVALVTCLYDSLNYMLTSSDLQQVFDCVADSLHPGGAFMADMNTAVTLEQVWGNNTFFVEGNDLALILRSGHEPETGLSTVDIVGFVRGEEGLYSRFEEHHTEASYEESEVRSAFEVAGLQVEAAYECFGFLPPTAKTKRIMWVARRPTS